MIKKLLYCLYAICIAIVFLIVCAAVGWSIKNLHNVPESPKVKPENVMIWLSGNVFKDPLIGCHYIKVGNDGMPRNMKSGAQVCD